MIGANPQRGNPVTHLGKNRQRLQQKLALPTGLGSSGASGSLDSRSKNCWCSGKEKLNDTWEEVHPTGSFLNIRESEKTGSHSRSQSLRIPTSHFIAGLWLLPRGLPNHFCGTFGNLPPNGGWPGAAVSLGDGFPKVQKSKSPMDSFR